MSNYPIRARGAGARRLVGGALVGALVAIGAAACSSSSTATSSALFDRPTDLTFGCVGAAPLADGGVASVAAPTTACTGAPDGGTGSQSGLSNPTTYAIAIEPTQGTAILVSLRDDAEAVDSDPFSPGYNGLPVGRMPVGIVTVPSGCLAVTANRGSCDLGVIDVQGAVAQRANVVTRRAIAAAGGVLAAAPAAIAAGAAREASGLQDCAAGPAGIVYVAYPGCGLVAVVNLAASEAGTPATVLGGVSFATGAAPSVTGTSVACPVECPERTAGAAVGAPPAGSPQPSALAVEPAGGRLYIGAWNSPELTIVELDASGLPTGASSIALEGAVGIERLAATGPVAMGNAGSAGTFRFVYAVAADGTVHVVDVTPGRTAQECETQPDPREARSVVNLSQLSCLRIGEVPRRHGALGPGIQLPHGAVPRDVAFITGSTAVDPPDPTVLNGTFAVITAEDPFSVGQDSESSSLSGPRGVAFYVNVNDENYPDTVAGATTFGLDIVLALPHTLRDAIEDREEAPTSCTGTIYATDHGPIRINSAPSPAASAEDDWDDLEDPPSWAITNGDLELPSDSRRTLVPMLHQEYCSCTDTSCDGSLQPVWSLAATAPADARAIAFPDLQSVVSESWSVRWQGRLVYATAESERGGGRVEVDRQTWTLRLTDSSAPFCSLGTEQYDIVELLGCDSDEDCGLSEVCYVHPAAPAGADGMCVPSGRESELASACADLMTSHRRYTAAAVSEDAVVLASRPVVLAWSPVEGCTSDAECTQIREAEALFREAQEGIDPATGDDPIPRYTWQCTSDPSFLGVSRCVETCDPLAADPGCSEGSVCQAGRCVEGPIPAAVCFAAAQRYEVRAAFAYTVVGSQTGYLHPRTVDPATGQCVDDPTAGPLEVGRFHQTEPACLADADLTVVSPNPCSLTLEEPVVVDDAPATRSSAGIRFRSRGVTFDIADVTVPLPEVPGASYSPVPPGYQFILELASGFTPLREILEAALPVRVLGAPDGSVWIVDSGDQSGIKGKLIHFVNDPDAPIDTYLY